MGDRADRLAYFKGLVEPFYTLEDALRLESVGDGHLTSSGLRKVSRWDKN